MVRAGSEKFKNRKKACRCDLRKEKVALENDQSCHNKFDLILSSFDITGKAERNAGRVSKS